MAIGIGGYFGLKVEPPLSVGVSALLAAVGALLFAHKSPQDREIITPRKLILWALALIVLGFFAVQIRTHVVATPLLVKALGPVDVIGTVERVEKQDTGSRIVLSDLIVERLEPEMTPRKVRLKLRKDGGIQSGQRIKVLAKLNPPSSPVSPSAFDFQRYAYFKGIGAVGFIYNTPEIIEPAAGGSYFWAKVRERLSERIDQHLNGKREGAIATALMTGQRGAIEKDDIQAMRDAGLAHLLAISGMHVGMIVGVLFFFSRLIMASVPKLALHYPIKKYAAIFALIGALIYTLIVGATIPTQRALMMSGLVLFAIVVDRTAISMRLVALAAVVVLLFAPESLVSVSFQMSFAAVVALVAFYEWLKPYWTRFYSKAGFVRRASLYFSGVVLTTVIAGFSTGFFALYHFQTFALYGTIANVIAVPITAFVVMPSLLLSFLLMPIGLEGLSLDLASWAISWILASAHWVAGMDGSVTRVSSWPLWPFIIIVICLWIMCVWQGWLKSVALAVSLIMLSIISVYKQPIIQISSDYNLIGFKDVQGDIFVSSGRSERYTADNWRRRNGQSSDSKRTFPKDGQIVGGFPLLCDDHGCRGEIEGLKISYAKDQKAVNEDCTWADLLLSPDPVNKRLCNSRFIIDRFDVWREGAHAIWVNGDDIKIKTDANVRGKRPWNNRADLF
ncbi:MAG: ComEC/Rec2 family competence protein [Alphaproteobacteria bacterium]|nr:ComEC/Rec2 family competence protein [Alphaproteobacteria bacterium]